MVKDIIASIANAFNYQLIGAENVIEFKETSVLHHSVQYCGLLCSGITAAFVMTNGVIGLTATTTEFKRRGIIKRLSITPLTKLNWILGNVLSQTLLNLMLAAIMIGAGWTLYRVTIIPDAFSIIMILLGSVMFSGIGMMLSGFIKDVEAASAVGNAIAFPIMFLSGTFFPLELMPSYLQTISKALPSTYFSEGLKYSMLYKYPEGIYTNIAILAALAFVFIIIGALVTRWKAKSNTTRKPKQGFCGGFPPQKKVSFHAKIRHLLVKLEELAFISSCTLEKLRNSKSEKQVRHP